MHMLLSRTPEHAAVIAGGGPTGLMLAGELALARVNIANVERRHPGPPRLARRGSARAHHRGARSAWHRRSIPFGGRGSQRSETGAPSHGWVSTREECHRVCRDDRPSWRSGSSAMAPPELSTPHTL
jgi:2-polyprenyl-6-methoxyphenol hydroxylase-like FAD-dependent oxidoreductase